MSVRVWRARRKGEEERDLQARETKGRGTR